MKSTTTLRGGLLLLLNPLSILAAPTLVDNLFQRADATTQSISTAGTAAATAVQNELLAQANEPQPSATGSAAPGPEATGIAAANTTTDTDTTDLATSVSGSCFSPRNRQCWLPGYDINTDYDTKTPPGTIRRYNWDIEEISNWKGPDGVVKSSVMLVNGQFPGPTLRGNWGDTFQITVTNRLKSEGTGIHWHGLRQLHTNIMDGVPGVTECPLKPGMSKTYTFKAQQYGTSWYHSHYSSQYGNGVWGSIVINGPSSANYDIDLGAYPISDYYYGTVEELYADIASKGPPPNSDNIMFKGRNINPAGPGGAYSKITLTPGKKHLLRLINPSTENMFQLAINGHSMTIVETDFVPVKPTTVQNLFLGIGQRVNVIIEANQKIDNYWFNVTLPAENLCGASANPYPAAIVHYAGADPKRNPTDRGTAPPNLGCRDSLSYTPVVSKDISLDKFVVNNTTELDVQLAVQAGTQNVIWTIDNTTMVVDWRKPIVEYVLEGSNTFPASLQVIKIPQKDELTFWVINNDNVLDHPIHLHGHDFWVVGASANGAGPFVASRDQASLRTMNPSRRDVTMAPANGWLVLAFKSDNPGAWLMHCHIAWHVEGGFGVNFLEQASAQKGQISGAQQNQFKNECAQWQAYGVEQQWSGLR